MSRRFTPPYRYAALQLRHFRCRRHAELRHTFDDAACR